MGLFRKEVLNSRQHRLQGTVVLTQPLSLSMLVAAIVLLVALLVSFLALASYSRKETVRGYLKPDKGVIKTYGQLTGYVDALYVKEGEFVVAGQPLLTLSTRAQFGIDNTSNGLTAKGNENIGNSLKLQGQSGEQSENMSALSDRLIKRLSRQIYLLEQEQAQYQRLQASELESLKVRNRALMAEQKATQQQGSLLANKLEILSARQQKMQSLFRQGFVSERENQNHHQQLLDLQQERQVLKRVKLQQQRELARMNFELQSIPDQYQLKVNAVQRHIAELENQLGKIRSNRRFTVRANRNGTVTGLQVTAGESVNPATLLLSLIPENSVLLAELFVPTRSAGFIAPGQQTKFRFDAFPYQRFGFIDGNIMQIDLTIINPNELMAPIAIQEPVYRIQAQLQHQDIAAYENNFALRSGMLFQADIILEERSLLAWLFEPLLRAAKKL
ncbi:HlyD family efflux transporter periplasmic adaptor subunit [Thalassotalea litorea]|uniref:HlyD family efflux transporter periplasmic adaptor subunit n=1 Tax=Thalassotalea litorea TaxID=2020715 RepID=UPI003736FFAB